MRSPVSRTCALRRRLRRSALGGVVSTWRVLPRRLHHLRRQKVRIGGDEVEDAFAKRGADAAQVRSGVVRLCRAVTRERRLERIRAQQPQLARREHAARRQLAARRAEGAALRARVSVHSCYC